MFKELYLAPLHIVYLEGKLKVKVEDFNEVPEAIRSRVITPRSRVQGDSVKWLYLALHYEMNGTHIQPELVEFAECPSKVLGLRCKYIMQFKEPILFRDGFYVVPGFTGFAVNDSGEVVSIRTDKRLKQVIGPYGYPCLNLYDPDKGKWRQVSTHILVARTFIKNPTPWSKPFINHKDGVKTNMSPDNLEWVSSSENSEHAIASSLRSDNIRCKILDHITGIITVHDSVTKAIKSIGGAKSSTNVWVKAGGKIYPRLLKNRYEIRYESDESPWHYVTEELRNTSLVSVPPFIGKNLKTGETFEATKIKDLAKWSGVNVDRIYKSLREIEMTSIDDFVFREKCDSDWPSSIKPRSEASNTKTIFLKNVITGEDKVLASQTKACKFLNVDKATIRSRIETGKLLNDWKLSNSPPP